MQRFGPVFMGIGLSGLLVGCVPQSSNVSYVCWSEATGAMLPGSVAGGYGAPSSGMYGVSGAQVSGATPGTVCAPLVARRVDGLPGTGGTAGGSGTGGTGGGGTGGGGTGGGAGVSPPAMQSVYVGGGEARAVQVGQDGGIQSVAAGPEGALASETNPDGTMQAVTAGPTGAAASEIDEDGRTTTVSVGPGYTSISQID